MANYLQPEPLAAWLTAKIAQLGGSQAAGLALGVDEAQIRRLVAGDNRGGLQVDTADRLFVAAGEPHMLAVLYPLDVDDLVERWCSTCAETVTTSGRKRCPWCYQDPPSVRRRPQARQGRAATELAAC